MNESHAKAIAQKEVGPDYTVALYKEVTKAYVYKCDSHDPEMIPSVLIVAVNKLSEKTGSSMTSVSEAVSAC